MKRELELDEDLKNGPSRNRSITDCVCCIIFIILWAACVWVTIFAFRNGDPARLVQAYDKENVKCGSKNDGTEEFPVAYIYQPFDGLTDVVCLKKCPQWNKEEEEAPAKLECFGGDSDKNKDRNYCSAESAFDFETLPDSLPEAKKSPFLIYNTINLFDRFCSPNLKDLSGAGLEMARDIAIVGNVFGWFDKIFSDLRETWRYIVLIAAMAIIICIIFLFLIRWMAGVLVWILILLFICSIFFLAVYSKRESDRLKLQEEQTGIKNESFFFSPHALYVYSIILYIIGGICFLGMIFSVGSITLAIAVLKSSALFIFDNPLVILTPLFHALLMVVHILFGLIVLFYLWSIGTEKPRGNSPFASYDWDEKTTWIGIFHIFSFLWNLAFIKYLSVFIVGCVCSIWYFNKGRDEVNLFRFPILTAYWWTFRYHLGSLAFASFIMAIIWTIQLIMAYIMYYVEQLKKKGVESKLVEWSLKILMYCIGCCETVIEFISKKGLIQVAVSSRNFCRSSMDAFLLIMNNPLRFGLVDSLALIFVYIGKLFVGAASGLVGYWMLDYRLFEYQGLNSVWIPVVVFIFMGYYIAHFFFGIYGDSADTIIQCFFLDKEINKNTGRPPIAPEPMLEFYEKFKKED